MRRQAPTQSGRPRRFGSRRAPEAGCRSIQSGEGALLRRGFAGRVAALQRLSHLPMSRWATVFSALLTVIFFVCYEDFFMQRAQRSQRKEYMVCFFSTSVSCMLNSVMANVPIEAGLVEVAGEARAKFSAISPFRWPPKKPGFFSPFWKGFVLWGGRN